MVVGADILLEGVVKSQDGKQAVYHASDPKATYTLVGQGAFDSDYNPECVQWVDPSNVDYNLVPASSASDASKIMDGVWSKGKPLSYMQVQTVEEGAEWYRRNTKYPDEVCDMMAKYEWGDLRYTTKKEFRNMEKRTRRRKEKPPALQVKRGPVLVHFD